MAAPRDTTDLLVAIGGLLGGLGTLALIISKLIRMWNQGRASRGDRESRWAIESFQASIKALQEENSRCWEENGRLRGDITAAEERHRSREEELQLDLGAANETIFHLNQQVQAYMLHFGKIDGTT